MKNLDINFIRTQFEVIWAVDRLPLRSTQFCQVTCNRVYFATVYNVTKYRRDTLHLKRNELFVKNFNLWFYLNQQIFMESRRKAVINHYGKSNE